MIIVRDIFIAKPGLASKLAKMWKEQMPAAKIMTDVTGRYNTVVMETEYDSLTDWDAMMKKYMDGSKQKSGKSAGPNYTEMYTSGRREIFRVW